MAPTVAKIAETLKEVQLVSITNASPESALELNKQFFSQNWVQVTGSLGVEAFKLYRIESVPTYYVLDDNGLIIAKGHAKDWADILAVLTEKK